MARPQSYSADSILSSALDVFWRLGYEASSIRRLLEAMEINRGTLYTAFSGKEALFLAAMARYEEDIIPLVEEVLMAEPDPEVAIRRFFHDLIGFSDPDTLKRGCLLFNSVSELACSRPHLARRAAMMLDRLQDCFEVRVREGQSRGVISRARTPREFARYLLSLLAGVRCQGKMDAGAETLKEMVDTGLLALSPLSGTGADG